MADRAVSTSMDKDFVRKQVEEGATHAVISEELQAMFQGLRGLGEPSVRCFCTGRDISRRCSLTVQKLRTDRSLFYS